MAGKARIPLGFVALISGLVFHFFNFLKGYIYLNYIS